MTFGNPLNVGSAYRIRADWSQNSRTQPYMQPRVTVLTLAVDDLERSVAFYRDGLGFHTRGIVGEQYENGAVAFFELQGGLQLALWPRRSLCADTGLPVQPPCPSEFTLGHNVASEQEVDVAMARAAQAGAQILKPAQHTSWGGYAGYFQDPDGHVWEVVFNPEFSTLGR
jgi:catechol 2,3-dioxygenase-like lactoylglutathione lyase family enzyme